MIVNEIFYSIEGEGKRAGQLAVFIRLAGCNICCSYCDTKYALKHDQGTEMSIPEILSKVEELAGSDLKNVTLTGGEPLIHEHVYDLIDELMEGGYEVNVETNGTILPELDSRYHSLFYTMDYKSLSSGQTDKMNEEAIKNLHSADVLKFVVSDIKDLLQAVDVVNKYRPEAKIYVSPVFGKIEPKEIVDFMQSWDLHGWTLQLQLHKLIWSADMRGV